MRSLPYKLKNGAQWYFARTPSFTAASVVISVGGRLGPSITYFPTISCLDLRDIVQHFYNPLNMTFPEFSVLTPFVELLDDRQARRVQRPDLARSLGNEHV